MGHPLRYRARRWALLVAVTLAVAASAAGRGEGAGDVRPSSAREMSSDQPKGPGEQMVAWKFAYLGQSLADVAGGPRLTLPC